MAFGRRVPTPAQVRSLIEAGDPGGARAQLRRIARLRPKRPREELVGYAWAALGCESPDLAVRLLYPVIHPSRPEPCVAEEPELEAYAAALGALGLSQEGLGLLAAARSPGCGIQLAAAQLRRWDPEAAIERLERLLADPDVASGELAGEARVLLAVALLQRGADLSRAAQLLREVTARGGARISGRARHWLAAVSGGPAGLRAARRDFETLGCWEDARLCELLEAVQSRDEAQARRVFAGSPFVGLRRGLAGAMAWSPDQLPRSFVLRVGEAEGAQPPLEPEAFDPGRVFDWGSVPFRAFYAIAGDPFHAPTVALLHERAFPGERHHPLSSPHRVRQAVSRARELLERAGAPVRLVCRAGRYRLEAIRPVALVLRADALLPGPGSDPREARLREAFGQGIFSAAQAEPLLGLRRWSSVSWLRRAVAEGRAERTGMGPATRYRIR
ncbi:MAG: hypothetical protein IT285_12110 [Bdellovibrionales bacterium]|nr:hypothetical protein [Bdellovibrionales bacterium]